MRRSEHIQAFVLVLWEWFDAHKRDLPWRDLNIQDDTERAYQILVSEVMLQQTQVSRVKIVFKRFLEAFPTIADLASASNKDVILAWRGMGYNSRALRLRDAAQTICDAYKGVFPREMTELQSIKGIGHYTAAAVRNFAFCLPTPCLDTNIRRILHRSFVGPENLDGTWVKNDRYLLSLAGEVLDEAMKYDSKMPGAFGMPRHTSAQWHAALMDYGSLVCTKSHPKWEICPLTKKGLMKAAYKVEKKKSAVRKEPGRLVGSVFVPNRIFRGKIVEELRDEERGLYLPEIGRRICLDWSEQQHAEWLDAILKKLIQDRLIHQDGNKYALSVL